MQIQESSHGHSLLRNRDFKRLWSSHAVSGFGSAISLIALPLTSPLRSARASIHDAEPAPTPTPAAAP